MMTAKPQSYLYIGDAAARASEFDIIIRRSGRYFLCEMGCGAVTNDWYLIEESQPHQPMFRLDKIDGVSFDFAQKYHMVKYMHYVACAKLCKNYSDALHYIETLGLDSVRELESISWQDRRWRLFPVNKVDPPPPAIQESMNALAEWFRRDTTSVVMIQPKIRPVSKCKATWLNMHEWAPRDIRRLLLSYLNYGDMIMVEAAHGLKDKLKLPIVTKYPNLICWYVRNGHPIDHTLCKALTSWHLYYPMKDLVPYRNAGMVLDYAIANNNVDFINALADVIPLCSYESTYRSSFAYEAARSGHYDLMFDLMLPCDVYAIYELVANNKRVDICERMHARYPMKHANKQCINVIATALRDDAMLEFINTITPVD